MMKNKNKRDDDEKPSFNPYEDSFNTRIGTLTFTADTTLIFLKILFENILIESRTFHRALDLRERR